LVEMLRIYAQGGSELQLEPRMADLRSVLEEAIEFCKLFPSVKSLSRLEFKPPRHSLSVNVDAPKLEQVILNLVKNAAEACGPGQGEVEISISDPPEHVIISVRDNGPGIPQEIAQRIWGGFFSTKGEDGTGLGLMMSRKIVEAHGGELVFENNRE